MLFWGWLLFGGITCAAVGLLGVFLSLTILGRKLKAYASLPGTKGVVDQ